ncbi:uncharacterized protein K444DRAFT_711065 [Hyaloscypha bicolor E]|uniref:Uncharacterized protein n=1 Tax=Hyaloscypha bicolor E TaxID=1095630 RepID=A0A2J6SJD5_9HELO|nr:uncharacterized protein K444DRAFT_711065 [Hyaloscypha bicolor E]PMD50850.1 hypothetical protein K444DRAFT_711065 [Hyaloscypha bicolor E]
MDVPRKRNGIRLGAVIPFTLSTVAFALTLLAVLSGSHPNIFEDGDMVTVNSSCKCGSIRVSTGATSTAGAGGFLSSLLGPAQGILGDLGNVFDGIVSNLTTDLDSGLTNLEKGLAANITKELGIQQYYSLYVNGICMGSFDNGSDPNSAANSTRCTTYPNAASGLSNFSIPNSITLGTTNISVPILASVSGTGGTITSAVTILTKAILAFFILSLIHAMTAIGSGVGFLLPGSSIAVYLNLSFSILGWIFHAVGTALSTAVIATLNLVASSIGNSVGVYSAQGTKFLIFVGISFAFLLISSFYWVAIWFVEFRKFTLRVRKRSSDEIGNWRGIVTCCAQAYI